MTYVQEPSKNITLTPGHILGAERHNSRQCAAKFAIREAIPEATHITVNKKGITWKTDERRYRAPIDQNIAIRTLASLFDQDGKYQALRAFFPTTGDECQEVVITLDGIESEAITHYSEEKRQEDRIKSQQRKMEYATGIRAKRKTSGGTSTSRAYRW